MTARFSRRRLLASALCPAPALPLPAAVRDLADRAEPLNGIDVVDAHAHVQSSPAGAIWPRAAELLLQDMDRCGIRVAVFSHFGALKAATAAELRSAHDDCARLLRAHPNRFRAYVVFQPHLPEVSMDLARRLLVTGSAFAGFKLHAAFHRYPVDGPAYQAACRFASEGGFPVLIHIAGEDDPATAGKLKSLAARASGAGIILAHLGSALPGLASLLEDCPNIFIDTCSSVCGFGEMERLVERAGVRRILFATDATYLSVGAQLAKIAFASLPEDGKLAIFAANARRVFGSRLPLAI